MIKYLLTLLTCVLMTVIGASLVLLFVKRQAFSQEFLPWVCSMPARHWPLILVSVVLITLVYAIALCAKAPLWIASLMEDTFPSARSAASAPSRVMAHVSLAPPVAAFLVGIAYQAGIERGSPLETVGYCGLAVAFALSTAVHCRVRLQRMEAYRRMSPR